MPKKKNQESQEEQSERFKKAVADLVAAGELDPTEAGDAFEKLIGKVRFAAGTIESSTNNDAQ